MQHKVALAATKGSYNPGDKVEVLSTEEGFSDAWATATLINQAKGSWLIEYSKFVDADGKLLREKVCMPFCCRPRLRCRRGGWVGVKCGLSERNGLAAGHTPLGGPMAPPVAPPLDSGVFVCTDASRSGLPLSARALRRGPSFG